MMEVFRQNSTTIIVAYVFVEIIDPCHDHCNSWLAFARSWMAMVSLPRSCHDLLGMDLGKGTMASNTGESLGKGAQNS